MRKRIQSLAAGVTALVLLLALAGCGGGVPAATPTPSESQPTPTPSPVVTTPEPTPPAVSVPPSDDPEAGRAAAFEAQIRNTPNVSEAAYFDMDRNGSDELILKVGEVEAEFEYQFYDYWNEMAVLIGFEGGEHSYLASDGESLIIAGGHMGHEWAYRISYDGVAATSEKLFEKNVANEDYTQWPYMLPVIHVSDEEHPNGEVYTSRANGGWSRTVNRKQIQNLYIYEDGTFTVAVVEGDIITDTVSGTYEIIDDDGKYQSFVFSAGDSLWSARIWQTNITVGGKPHPGLIYFTEDGERLQYTGNRWT